MVEWSDDTTGANQTSNRHINTWITARNVNGAWYTEPMLRRNGLWPILIFYILLATAYSVVNPLFEAPDEVWHYEFARWLAEGRGLPQPEDFGTAPWAQEGSQPPLYYLAAAAITAAVPTDNANQAIRYNPHAAVGDASAADNHNRMVHDRSQQWPWQGVVLAAHLARLLSVLCGATTVVGVYAIATRIFPTAHLIAPLAAALVAFNPQFLFINAAVSNDSLVTALCTLGLWVMVTLLMRGNNAAVNERQRGSPSVSESLLLGALVGAASLSKLSGLLLALPAALTLVLCAWRTRSVRTLLITGSTAGAAALAVAGWWYWRNWQLFGDPLALNAHFAVLPARPEPASWAEVLTLSQGVWRSSWAVFGWFNLVADDWLYTAYSLLSVAALAGLLAATIQTWRGGRRTLFDRATRWPLLILLLWLLLVVASLVRWAQINHPQGRLLFPAIGAFAVLAAAGLVAALPTRWRALGVPTLCALLTIPALFAPLRWIAPAYAPPAPTADYRAQPLNAPAGIQFGATLRLLDAEVDSTSVQPGGAVDVLLHWMAVAPVAADYSVFVHATDEVDILQAQHDSYPGGGNLPTSMLTPFLVYPDRHRLTIPLSAYAPARLRIDVGLYDAATGDRLATETGTVWTVGEITLQPRADDGIPNPTFVNFDDKLALVGFALDQRVLRPGDQLTVRYWWQALAGLQQDYVVFTHLVLPPDVVWAQTDRQPQNGAAATSTWLPGQRITDEQTLSLPSDAPAGVYRIEIGVYDKDSFDRLPVNFDESGVIIGQVRVLKSPP